MTQPTDIQKLVEDITSFVNSFTPDEAAFIKAMSREHPTLQQSFTRLVLKWLEHISSSEYRFDDRNKASHEVAEKLVLAFRSENGWNNPSNFIPCI